MPVNLFELAVQDGAKRAKDTFVVGFESSLLFTGSRGAGKSTLIHLFLQKNDPVKPTLALEYAYGRKTSKNPASSTKDVCHIWDLQGGSGFVKLLETPLQAKNLANLTVVLMLDLSQPKKLWMTAETLIYEIRARVKSQLEKNPDLEALLFAETAKRLGEDHPDLARTEPLPIPVVIIGGKYDIFQDFEPENKKLICRTLRHVAVWMGASLIFYSNKDPNLIKLAKEMLGHHAFRSQCSNVVCQDYNKPLFIPAGSDSFKQIESSGGEAASNFELWKHAFATVYPQVTDKIDMPDDPRKDEKFRDPEIDAARKAKDEELERYRKELENRAEIF